VKVDGYKIPQNKFNRNTELKSLRFALKTHSHIFKTSKEHKEIKVKTLPKNIIKISDRFKEFTYKDFWKMDNIFGDDGELYNIIYESNGEDKKKNMS
jgi:hypothetical protein